MSLSFAQNQSCKKFAILNYQKQTYWAISLNRHRRQDPNSIVRISLNGKTKTGHSRNQMNKDNLYCMFELNGEITLSMITASHEVRSVSVKAGYENSSPDIFNKQEGQANKDMSYFFFVNILPNDQNIVIKCFSFIE